MKIQKRIEGFTSEPVKIFDLGELDNKTLDDEYVVVEVAGGEVFIYADGNVIFFAIGCNDGQYLRKA